MRGRRGQTATGWLAALIAATAIVVCASGCAPTRVFAPKFESPGAGAKWHSTGISSSVSATDAAKQMVNRIPGGMKLEGLFPIYAPPRGTSHVSWDALVPTGVTAVVYKQQVRYGNSTAVGIRRNFGSGTWESCDSVPPNTTALGVDDLLWFLQERATFVRALGGETFEARFVPTYDFDIMWMLIRTASGRQYATPISYGIPGQRGPRVDGQRLALYQLRSPDAIRHPFTSGGW